VARTLIRSLNGASIASVGPGPALVGVEGPKALAGSQGQRPGSAPCLAAQRLRPSAHMLTYGGEEAVALPCPPDMVAQVKALARLVRFGGVLAVTTWGPRFFVLPSSVAEGSAADLAHAA
jgi:hypothetical protein